ncbi:type IV toxin-antitoxin system AbiEi family antitoxin domain-containing protein [Nocardioidaceae bacterium SCSIO 66511]|nr:type IV toxin-antitoxin system AbiEi family antitoxin domain-containing protein [Nocardioidaceae bacterium SCSIO 66511]
MNDDGFFSWAIERGGFFTRGEAIDCGMRDSQLRQAVRAKYLVRLRHGYYSPSTYVESLDSTERHALLARAVHHRLGDRYALAGISACAVQGVELWSDDLTTVHVVRIDGRTGRKEAGVRYHEFPVEPEADVVSVGAVRAMNPAHAVWQAGCDQTIERGLVSTNSALHRGIVTAETLRSRAAAFSRWPGSRGARIAIGLADPRVESVGESRTFYLCWEQHLPLPEPQFEVIDDAGTLIGRTDFAWHEYRHVAEFDGAAKYSRYLRPGESISDAVMREKVRENLIRAELFGVTRIIWIELTSSKRLHTARTLHEALDQSRRLYTRNRTVVA